MKKELFPLGIGAVLFAAALLLSHAPTPARFALFLLAFFFSGAKVIISAGKSIAGGNLFNENTLMLIAAIGAFAIGEYPEAVFVVLFYRVGELFEDYAVKKSRKSISDVMNLCPDHASVLADGTLHKVGPDEVSIGDVIVVAAGERVPLDGTVIQGSSFIDTSALTGESVPRAAREGDEILSGCINQSAVLHIRVSKTFDDSTVSRILELVETAGSRKSSPEKFITRFARYYTPIVLACAALLAVVPPLLIPDAAFSDYLYRALSFLVVSCPCALVISVPLAFFGGIGGAAKQGILIKGGNYLEVLAQARQVVFDKTGTLTAGSFTVQQVLPAAMAQETLLELAAYAEHASAHPIAQSIRQAYGRQLDVSRITASREISGHGVETVVDGRSVAAGNQRLMDRLGITCPETNGGTAVFVAVDGRFAGAVVIADQLKPDAQQGIAALKRAGIRSTCMLTGDRRPAAETVAQALGIDIVKSELLPGDKVAQLEQLMAAGTGKTVYVGDGINDAPVLARADAGIAMGALGSDAAIEAADIVIMTDEISKVETALTLARRTMAIARQNILFSVAIKLMILLLCSLNIVGMGVAVFGDVGVMVLAVLNSFRAMER